MDVQPIPIIIVPFLTLLLGAILCLLFWDFPKTQLSIATGATGLFLISSIVMFVDTHRHGIHTVQIGGWQAPYGITLVGDALSTLMVTTSAVIAVAVVLYAIEDIPERIRRRGFYPLFLFLLFGVTGAFMAGDIFNLYVWFEVMLVSSFVLVAIGNTNPQLEGSVKYILLNIISSGFLLTGIGILYNTSGTLNMADLATIASQGNTTPLFMVSSVFFFTSFGLKAAIFPLFFWLPASYHTPPISIAALLAGLLTKVGIYSMIRCFTLFLTQRPENTQPFMLVIAALTMITGVLGSIAYNDIRKILSFQIICQIGYIFMGLVIYTPLAIAGAVFYIVHHMIVETNLFLISGMARHAKTSFNIKRFAGLYEHFPLITFLLLLSSFSLAGSPPLSGFWGKLILMRAGIEAKAFGIVAVGLIVGLLTLYVVTRIWKGLMAERSGGDTVAPEDENVDTVMKGRKRMTVAVTFLTMCMLFISFFAESLLSYAMMVSEQLLDPSGYIDAVLSR